MEDGAEVEKDEGEGGNDGEKGDEERRRDVIEHIFVQSNFTVW